MPVARGDGFVVPVRAFGQDEAPQIVTQAAQLLLSEEFPRSAEIMTEPVRMSRSPATSRILDSQTTS